MKHNKLYLLILLTIMGLILVQPIAAYAQAPNVVEAICNSISGFPFHGSGDFSESDNCEKSFSDVRGSYTAAKLDGALFASPGQDENGDPIDISDEGTLWLSWNVDTTRGMLDDAAQSSRAECPVVDTAISSTLPGVFVHPGCVSASGYWIPVDFSYGIAAGYAESYVVTPCYDIRVEVTIYAGSPAPEDRQRSVMAEAEKFTKEASNALINATKAACDFIFNGLPPSGDPSTGKPAPTPSSNSVEISTPQGTQNLTPGQKQPINLAPGQTAEVRAICDEIRYGLLLILLDTDRMENANHATFIQFSATLDVICSMLKQERQSVTAAQFEPGAIGLTIEGGRIQAQVLEESIGVQVETDSMTASTKGAGAFSVSKNSSGETTVAAQSAELNVQAKGAGSGNVFLTPGQEVQVTPSGIGAPGPIGSTSPPRNSLPPDPPTIAPPAGNGSDLASYDADGSCTFEDNEFFNVVDAWISEILQDSTFFMAVDYWIGQTSLCASTASVNGLSLEEVNLSINRFSKVTFSIAGKLIASSELQIFDLNGNQIHQQTSHGKKLTWNLKTSTGAVVANGVYLFRVIVENAEGATISSSVKKIVLLR